MIARTSSVAFIIAVLAWPAYALGWTPGGLLFTTMTSAVCFLGSYLSYRVVRMRHDAQQVADLRMMQEREGMSDHELFGYVSVRHPNLLDGFVKPFAKTLLNDMDASKKPS